jgi:hypothetical protein
MQLTSATTIWTAFIPDDDGAGVALDADKGSGKMSPSEGWRASAACSDCKVLSVGLSLESPWAWRRRGGFGKPAKA